METETKPQSAQAVLRRVREILEVTCAQDGMDFNTQEQSRRKAYRVGINHALEEISNYKPRGPKPRRTNP